MLFGGSHHEIVVEPSITYPEPLISIRSIQRLHLPLALDIAVK